MLMVTMMGLIPVVYCMGFSQPGNLILVGTTDSNKLLRFSQAFTRLKNGGIISLPRGSNYTVFVFFSPPDARLVYPNYANVVGGKRCYAGDVFNNRCISVLQTSTHLSNGTVLPVISDGYSIIQVYNGEPNIAVVTQATTIASPLLQENVAYSPSCVALAKVWQRVATRTSLPEYCGLHKSPFYAQKYLAAFQAVSWNASFEIRWIKPMRNLNILQTMHQLGMAIIITFCIVGVFLWFMGGQHNILKTFFL